MDIVPKRILIIETNEKNAASLENLLSASYSVSILNSGANAYKEVRTRKPDLVLMNLDLADCNGLELLSSLRTSTKTRNTFVTIITDNPSIDYEIQAFQLGILGYIRRPFDPEVLSAQISASMLLVQRFRTLEHLATIDPLTELPNRRAFNKTLTTEWGRSHRYGQWISLLIIDIDNFKSYNDRYGHTQGDLILQEVSRVFKSCINRSADSLFRMGGEEFAVVLPATDVNGAVEMAEHIRAVIAGHTIALGDNQSTNVTVSIGVSATIATVDRDMSLLMTQADQLMYQSKNTGKNKVSVKFDF